MSCNILHTDVRLKSFFDSNCIYDLLVPESTSGLLLLVPESSFGGDICPRSNCFPCKHCFPSRFHIVDLFVCTHTDLTRA